MAEIAVSAAITLLKPLITNEVSLISNLSNDVRIITEELDSISAILKSAEERAIGDEETKAWVKRVRNLAYDIEDIIEEYMLYKKGSTMGKAYKFLSFRVRNMATTIQCIRERVVEIGRAKEVYRPLSYDNNVKQGMGTMGTCSGMDPTTSMITMRMCVPEQESGVVGVEGPKRDIIELLLVRRNQHENGTHSIVAVVGMRGLGKTTLVHYVCNDPTIRAKFPMRAMISLSATPWREQVGRERVGILRSMMKQFYGDTINNQHIDSINSMSQVFLEQEVTKYLKETRYLIVFDDAREGDTLMVTYLQRVLPINKKGSKILVTTRYDNVARHWLGGSCEHPYRLKPLPPENAWFLFCKFQSYGKSNRKCPPYLVSLAKEIVKKCDGLPPAIMAIGRLLSTKPNDFNEWKKVHDSVGYYLQQNRHLTGIYEILTRTYYDVPCYLKPCFLYFGVFPKGYSVNKMRLIRLWIAEGFITKNSRVNLTLEDIAEEYIERLIDMNLIEVENKSPIDQRPKTLRVNEFLHEILLSKLDELRFCQVLSEKCESPSVEQHHRRLSIHKLNGECEVLKTITTSKPNIRSLLAFELTQDTSAKLLSTTFLNNAHLLRVLDLYGAPITDIPFALGNLRNLRYLSLRNTHVQRLPSSIDKLQDLQTLDLKHTKIYELPDEINKLHMLRHLILYMYKSDFQFSPHIQKVTGVRIPQGILKNLKELQKLAYMDVGHQMNKATIIRKEFKKFERLGLRGHELNDHANLCAAIHDMKELKNLRRLGVIGLELNDGKNLCVAVHEMKCLQAFNVYSKNKRVILDLEYFNHSSPPPQTLERLYLNGPLRCFPRWIFNLQNLIRLRLRWSSLNDSGPFENLSALPNLVELQLLEAYNGSFLEFKKGGFKKLKILSLLDLHALECLHINKATLPVLEELSIGESPKLLVPSGIQYLRTLKILTFFNMPLDFTNLIQPHQKYYDVVKHVVVSLKFKSPQGYWI